MFVGEDPIFCFRLKRYVTMCHSPHFPVNHHAQIWFGRRISITYPLVNQQFDPENNPFLVETHLPTPHLPGSTRWYPPSYKLVYKP